MCSLTKRKCPNSFANNRGDDLVLLNVEDLGVVLFGVCKDDLFAVGIQAENIEVVFQLFLRHRGKVI